MYGTIFTMKVKAGHEDRLLGVLNSREEPPAGGISWFLMNPDNQHNKFKYLYMICYERLYKVHVFNMI